MVTTVNFGFLQKHDERLATLGAQAERYFRDDPSTAIVKLRQFAELLAKLVAADYALYLGERESFEGTLRGLSFERIIFSPASGFQWLPSVRRLDRAILGDWIVVEFQRRPRAVA